ncbi:MAG: acyl-CoA desaturase, partial [Nitratireductor sp.]|nr:acyl-CoA desaturase [Nitratireductor sp.]
MLQPVWSRSATSSARKCRLRPCDAIGTGLAVVINRISDFRVPQPTGAVLPVQPATSRSAVSISRNVEKGIEWDWINVIGIAFFHLMALLALFPLFFSWSGLILAFLGNYLFGTLGINLFYHRFLTHKGFQCPKWLERLLAILAVCCFQDSPARWVAVHRRHHECSDEEGDPHSPVRGFLWAHVGWVLVKS